MSSTQSHTSCVPNSLNEFEGDNFVENDVIDLERPVLKKMEKVKRKTDSWPAEDIIEISRMKYMLLEELRLQE